MLNYSTGKGKIDIKEIPKRPSVERQKSLMLTDDLSLLKIWEQSNCLNAELLKQEVNCQKEVK